MYSFKLKLSLEKNGKFLISEGRAELLKLIKEYKSLAKAASRLGMSYRSAWGALKKLEQRAGVKIVSAKPGGRLGGRTELTKEGEELLRIYDERSRIAARAVKFPSPVLTVDGVVIKEGKILLVKRKHEPFKNYYALPGGFVEYNEKVEESVVREIKEETGLLTKPVGVFGVYSSPERDPRCHTVTIVYELKVIGGKLRKGEEIEDLRFFELDKIPELAFDHNKIIEDFKARDRVRVKIA